jgi:hypothetical protein
MVWRTILKISLVTVTFACCQVLANDPTDDTFIDEIGPGSIKGGQTSLVVRCMNLSNFELDALLKFDLSWIPPEATVKSATLALYYWRWWDCDPVGRQLDAFRITDDWDEDTTNWNNRPSYNPTPVATDYVPAIFSGMGWNVTASVQNFVNGTYPNYGWQIMDVEASGNCMIYFYSKEQPGTFGPGLVIDLDIIFVDAGATGANNGSSWTDAYTKLQDALSVAVSGDQIWVASGTYKPDQSGGQTAGNRNATFQLKNGVEIYGGFAGGETWRRQRDFLDNVAILSGDINTPGDDSDNSFHVVTSTGTNSTAVLDGFTIARGEADAASPSQMGGGLYNGGTPTVANCIFANNSSELYGGGVFNMEGSPRLINCTFVGNDSGFGGGVFNNDTSTPQFTNCSFYDNQAELGGGMYNHIVISPLLTNCTFSKNTASYGGGICNDPSASPSLTNCILWGNTDNEGSGTSSQIYEGSPVVTYSCIQDDDPNDGSIPFGGAANNNIDDDPRFLDAGSGNLRLSGGSPCIEAGNDAAVPPDTADLDEDGNKGEQTPLDLDLRWRFSDGDCDRIDTVDMGAYELVWVYRGDLDDDCDVDFADLGIMGRNWLAGK